MELTGQVRVSLEESIIRVLETYGGSFSDLCDNSIYQEMAGDLVAVIEGVLADSG